MLNHFSPEHLKTIHNATRALREGGVYVKYPLLDDAGLPTGQIRRGLYVFFSAEDSAQAHLDSNAVDACLHLGFPHRYTHERESLCRAQDPADPGVQARLACIKRENPGIQDQIPDESLIHHFEYDSFNPPLRVLYPILYQSADFEARYQDEVGILVIPGIDQLLDFRAEQATLYREILEHFGGRQYILEAEIEALHQEHPQRFEQWCQFFSGGFLADSQGQKAGSETLLSLSASERQNLSAAVRVLTPAALTDDLWQSDTMKAEIERIRLDRQGRFNFAIQHE